MAPGRFRSRSSRISVISVRPHHHVVHRRLRLLLDTHGERQRSLRVEVDGEHRTATFDESGGDGVGGGGLGDSAPLVSTAITRAAIASTGRPRGRSGRGLLVGRIGQGVARAVDAGAAGSSRGRGAASSPASRSTNSGPPPRTRSSRVRDDLGSTVRVRTVMSWSRRPGFGDRLPDHVGALFHQEFGDAVARADRQSLADVELGNRPGRRCRR